MTSTITEDEWQLVRGYFGDLAYEHPEMHTTMLSIARAQEIAAEARAILDRTPDAPPNPDDELK
ncbi:hypothetical protein [Rhizobium leguminosarum]|uniref:hypothetical protein n=1 Tax=Rhizobium leguminosarum TaxID=384 RepID=UPI003F9EA5D2